MDALLSVAFQEIAAHGPHGCRLINLWKWLEKPSLCAGLTLDTSTKQTIWTLLLSSGCLLFEVPGSGCVDSTDDSLQDLKDAEKFNVNIVGSENLRESFLGSCNFRHSDAKLSTIQRSILERLGEARTNGVTQYQIGKEFGISGNKLFYIIKSLQTRGLVVRHASIYRGERPVATNLIQLKRFSRGLKLELHQRFEIQNGSTSKIDHDVSTTVTGEEANQACNVKDTLINDDLPSLKEICRKIEDAENKVLIISDLKVNLGYRFTHGHRAWRRILNRLVLAGLVEVFDAKVENKVCPCIRLLKPFDVKAFTTRSILLNSNDIGLELNFKGAKRGKVTEQVAELPVNRQIYDTIKQGGADGVTVTEVFNRLGISNKKNYYRLIDMISKYDLQLQVNTYKRSNQYRVWVPQDSNPQVHADCIKENKHKQDFQVHSCCKNEEKEEISASNSPFHVEENSFPSADVISEDSIENKTPMSKLKLPNLEAKSSGANDSPVLQGSKAPITSPNSLPIAFSKCNQRIVPLSSAHAHREIQIMERLEKETFVLRSELHKMLEDLDGRKNTLLDRKTVARNLQKLQKEGRCKCMVVSLPGVSNYGQCRTVDVVLLPSVEVSPNIMTQIYERQRAFDILIRHESSNRFRNSKPKNIPTLSGVQRIPKTETVDKGKTLHDNGFISPKLVRSRMLHRFLWCYVSELSDKNTQMDEPDAVNKSLISGETVFSLLVATQSMPLELFLQVIGSANHIKGLSERCRRGMILADLPRMESESLLDLNASGRLAWLVDILRRLKLLRIVMIPHVKDHSDKSAQAGVAYALELNPYIDEPDLDPPSTISAHVLNLGPAPRHYFKLSSKESLEEYWKSLEYFYRGSESKIARRIFPGSTVPELFGARSWSSLRVMSMEQRNKLQERMGLHENKRVPYEECVRISRELNLSLDQVLGFSYERNQRIKLQKLQSPKQDLLNSGQINIALGTRSQTRKRSANGTNPEESTRLEIRKRRNHNNLDIQNKCTGRQSTLADKGKDIEIPEDDDSKDDSEINSLPCILVRKFRPLRKKKYMWTDGADRLLVACYTRQRAILGARYNRVEWNSISGLPAPADTCRRRIVYLKMVPIIRKSMMAVCNLLATRYTKYLRLHADHGDRLQDDSCNFMNEESREGKVYAWDDFEDPLLSAAIDDIIRRKNMIRLSSLKKSSETSVTSRSSQFCHKKFAVSAVPEKIGSSASVPGTGGDYFIDKGIPENVLQASDEILPGNSMNTHSPVNMKVPATARARPNRFNVRKKMQRPMTLRDVSSGEMIRKSAGVAMAVELIKLVFLNSAVESEVSQILVDALRRCQEADIFTAFRFLKDQALVAVGDNCHAFVLSPKFYQNSTTSPFTLSTSDESKQFERWLCDQKMCLDEDWVTLTPDPQWGELFHLFSCLLCDQLSIAPILPERGIGEKHQDENTRKRKRDFPISENSHATNYKTSSGCEDGGFGQRRERGFPGIDVKVHTAIISLESMLTMKTNKYAPSDMYNFSPPEDSVEESQWEGLLLEKGKTSSESNPQYCSPWHEDGSEHGNSLRPESLNSHAQHIIDNDFKVPMLEQVHAAILSAGETGIKIGDFIEIIRAEGKITVEITTSHARALYSLGLAREVMAFDHLRVVAAPYYEHYFLHVLKSGKEQEGSIEMVPVLPWLEADGKENCIRQAALHRRIMGIVMLNPGILEESIIEHLDVLNPTSCRKFLELMVLDGYLLVRTRMQYDTPGIPCFIRSVLPERSRQPKLVQRHHYFANSNCTALL